MRREYVVVTRFKKTPGSKPIVHVYGPYTQGKAKSVKGNMKEEARREGYESSLEVSAHHIIDIETMNRGVAFAVIRDQVLNG